MNMCVTTIERATDLLEIIHTDVYGPMNIEARGGYRYFLTFTDDLSRYGYIYLIFPNNKAATVSGRTSLVFLRKSPSVSLKLTRSPCLSGTLEKRFVFA